MSELDEDTRRVWYQKGYHQAERNMTRKLLEEALGVLESEYEGTDAHQELISNIRIYLTGVDRESCTHKFTHEVVAGDPIWCVNCGLEKILD